MFSQFTSLGSIVNYIEEACGEMAYDMFAEDNHPDLFRRARKAGIRDIPGYVADELYNDAELVSGLAADGLYELIGNDGKNPRDETVWKEYVAELQKRLPHVTLDM